MTAASTVHDPVCHMDIDPETAAGTSELEGTTYYFCGTGCKGEFDEDPAAALAAEAAHDHSQEASLDGTMKRPWWKFWERT